MKQEDNIVTPFENEVGMLQYQKRLADIVKKLDEKEAWERRQKEKEQPKYNFSLWGKLLAVPDE